jgi:FMN phosphatase YigB (HAD superfamily)
VGDTWDADVEGPHRLGMTPVHVHRAHDDRAAPPLPPGAHRVRDLRGLLDLLA